MGRRVIRIIMAAVLLLSMQLLVCAGAVGCIKVSLKGGGVPISGAEIMLHFVGYPTQGGYILTQGFGGGFVQEVDVLSPELAKWLAGKEVSGMVCFTDKNGEASFPNLEEGLYLVQQQMSVDGYTAFDPFLITLPWDGNIWDIHAAPKVDRIPTAVPDTSDPGTVEWGLRAMALSGAGTLYLLISYRKIGKHKGAEYKKTGKK